MTKREELSRIKDTLLMIKMFYGVVDIDKATTLLYKRGYRKVKDDESLFDVISKERAYNRAIEIRTAQEIASAIGQIRQPIKKDITYTWDEIRGVFWALYGEDILL